MKKYILNILLVIFLATPVLAEEEIDEVEQERVIDDKWNFSVTFENDFVSADDDNYTNGVRLSWLSPETTTPHWLERIANISPFFSEMGYKRIAYSLGQSMYTPEDIYATSIVPDERPYAGWLYGSVGLISDTGSRLERLELSLGVVGESALAEQTQREAHEWRNIDVPQGWDNQLKDEPGIILSYENAWRNYLDFGIWDYGLDFTPKAGFKALFKEALVS